MKLNAYILAADPAWIEASVLSYYDLVERIVVSYDQNALGWTGVPIGVEQCLRRLRAIDRDGKMEYVPGHYARAEFFERPMENDTYQRQCALDRASEGADWVLQLDTDEVILNQGIFFSCLEEAAAVDRQALFYPARWLYQSVGNGWFLESCTRLWRVSAGFPGPVSVRPKTQLRHARQCDVSEYRVDFRSRITDPWHAVTTPVHRVIDANDGILHFSMVRNERAYQKKTESWGHARDCSWSGQMKHWTWCRDHPILAMLMTPFSRLRDVHSRGRLRLCRIRDLPHWDCYALER
jgi:hypothetical protein